ADQTALAGPAVVIIIVVIEVGAEHHVVEREERGRLEVVTGTGVDGGRPSRRAGPCLLCPGHAEPGGQHRHDNDRSKQARPGHPGPQRISLHELPPHLESGWERRRWLITNATRWISHRATRHWLAVRSLRLWRRRAVSNRKDLDHAE